MTLAPDTIYALSSGAPPAAVAVLRVSGPAAGAALRALAGRLPGPRRAVLARLRDPLDGTLLDHALTLWLPGPATATGEDIAELHCHGGRAIVAAVLASLGRMPGLRLALPGEFTRRAFLAGRMDLAEVEGLSDLLHAETEVQRRAALGMFDGELGRRLADWRGRLAAAAVTIEAVLGFPDEGDVDNGLLAGARMAACAVGEEIAAVLAAPPAERLRDGVRVVLCGPPNSGKSSLFNALAGRDAAITSPKAGTTRDVLEANVAIGGLPFLLIDTAGLRQADGEIERIGVARARAAITAADVRLWLGPPDRDSPIGRDVLVEAKGDVERRAPVHVSADVTTSVVTGDGLDRLRGLLVEHVAGQSSGGQRTTHRQREHLAAAGRALAELGNDVACDAERIIAAVGALDETDGRVVRDDVLDEVFSSFCLGK